MADHNNNVHEEQLLDEGVAVAPRRSNSNKSTWLALAAIGVVAVVAFGVAVSAHSRSMTVASSGTEMQAQLGSTASHAANAELKAAANFKTQFAGMMLMNQPCCRQSHRGYVACLDLVHSAQKLITDLTDPEVSVEQVLENINGDVYDVGSAVAFATLRDDAIEAMSPVLAEVIESQDNHLTVNGVADLSKCEYVWRGVACLTMLESASSVACDNAADNRTCYRKIVPVIHILDELTEVDEHGNVRRRNTMQVIGAVAGGIKSGIQGGVAGAAAGGAVASIVPGIGTVAGGIVGGTIGAIGYGAVGAMDGWNTGSNMQAWK